MTSLVIGCIFVASSIKTNKMARKVKPRFTFTNGNILLVFNYAPTENKKITSAKKGIVQHYSFSREQYEHILAGGNKLSIHQFDAGTCGDCPFSYNQGYKGGKCYTHKYYQLGGLGAMLNSICTQYPNWEDIPQIPDEVPAELSYYAKGTFIRFGSYGETIWVPLGWMESLTKVCSSWTGYTHQWHKYPEYSKFMMASVHNGIEQSIATDRGWRTFAILDKNTPTIGNVVCPASKENNKSACDKCSLCSGTQGKGKKSVEIRQH